MDKDSAQVIRGNKANFIQVAQQVKKRSTWKVNMIREAFPMKGVSLLMCQIVTTPTAALGGGPSGLEACLHMLNCRISSDGERA